MNMNVSIEDYTAESDGTTSVTVQVTGDGRSVKVQRHLIAGGWTVAKNIEFLDFEHSEGPDEVETYDEFFGVIVTLPILPTDPRFDDEYERLETAAEAAA